MTRTEIDVCLWTKNNAKTLEQVLTRFDEATPQAMVGQKLMIDDSDGSDDTVDIGERHGWRVLPGPPMIAAKANLGLKRVRTSFFATMEADVLLAADWLPKLLERMKRSNRIAVAQGIRLPTDKALSFLIHRKDGGLAYSLDNTLYRTEIIRSLGGFPQVCLTCTDGLLKRRVEAAGYFWAIDTTLQSRHLKNGIRDYWKHWMKMQKLCSCSNKCYAPRNNVYLARCFLTSPVRAVDLALESGLLRMLFVYPYHRWKELEVGLRHIPYSVPNQNYGKEIVFRSST